MKLSESVKPISYVKAHASEIVRQVAEEQKALIITHNGEAKAVIQDIHSYEQTQEGIAMLKLLGQSSRSSREGESKPVGRAFRDIRRRIKDERQS